MCSNNFLSLSCVRSQHEANSYSMVGTRNDHLPILILQAATKLKKWASIFKTHLHQSVLLKARRWIISQLDAAEENGRLHCRSNFLRRTEWKERQQPWNGVRVLTPFSDECASEISACQLEISARMGCAGWVKSLSVLLTSKSRGGEQKTAKFMCGWSQSAFDSLLRMECCQRDKFFMLSWFGLKCRFKWVHWITQGIEWRRAVKLF